MRGKEPEKDFSFSGSFETFEKKGKKKKTQTGEKMEKKKRDTRKRNGKEN